MGEAEMSVLRQVHSDWAQGDFRRNDYLHPDFELVFARDFLDEGRFPRISASSRPSLRRAWVW
ncbi:MAG TPA: hypothetical protein VH300_15770 [Thermoleophilaceae bacterium]|jgi:hypothetical protein|nr:hypothetical protein [Thermoleophilaceae bacterium]